MSSLMSNNGLPPQNDKQCDGNYGNYGDSKRNGNGSNKNINNKLDVYDICAQPQRGGEVAMISKVDTMKLANSALNRQSISLHHLRSVDVVNAKRCVYVCFRFSFG